MKYEIIFRHKVNSITMEFSLIGGLPPAQDIRNGLFVANNLGGEWIWKCCTGRHQEIDASIY